MYIKDSLYGTFELEPVLADLINSDAVQRLKDVHQNGASYLVNPKWKNTRFDHSVGVMCLIRLLGGSLEEQIAGLLHDVSHTAFSHVVDDALKQKEENYHELIKDKIVLQSDIPVILKNHQFDLEPILDESKWGILEQPAPHLCADRIDYTLRDLYEYGEITRAEVEQFIESMTLFDGRIHLKDDYAAEWFVEVYYREVLDFFLHPLNIYSNHMMAELLKASLDLNILTEDDFMLTDEKLLEKLKDSTNSDIKRMLDGLTTNVQLEYADVDYDISVKKKMRLIDPDVIVSDTSIPISERSEKVRAMKETARKRSMEGTRIKVTT
ncbi:HD domain-containing protein [Pseudalkalibacillus sp. SCS-8]|uniref:HD domain-containing protein n=1 Tax=Pseudalkalibacillus nanhaiensis TaxID=3115291 RepID=UPI0032DAD338